MNKAIRALFYFLGSSVLIIAGCGPQTINALDAAGDALNDLQSTNLHKDGIDTPLSQAGNGCIAGQCKLPPDPPTRTVVQLPDQVEVQPTKIINTGEKHIATDVVDYHITRHVWQPVEIHHTVYEHRNLLRRFFGTEVFH